MFVLSGTQLYHRAKFYADRLHRRRDICPQTKTNKNTLNYTIVYTGAFLCSALTESDYCGSKQTVPIWFAYVSGVVPMFIANCKR